jgi:outer membrane murein-binding lipoprotein Lpp
MAHRRIVTVLVFAVVLSGVPSGAMADTYVSNKDESVRRSGIAYNIAEDRKVENINGVYEPEGLDKYLKRYMDKLSEKVDQLSAKIERLSDQVTQLSAKVDSSGAKKDTTASPAQSKII